MNRRDFLKGSGLIGFASTGFPPGFRLLLEKKDEEGKASVPNTNWADPALGIMVSASSYVGDPPAWLPWGYGPLNVLGDNLYLGWQAAGEAIGAWIEIDFGQIREVSELWLLAEPLPTDILGQYVYLTTSSRVPLLVTPRRIRIAFSDGTGYTMVLKRENYFQIVSLPQPRQTSSVRITVEDIWPKPGGKEAGLGKIRIFPQKHSPTFEVTTHAMYDVQNGRAVQAAILDLINPSGAISNGMLQVSGTDVLPMNVLLEAVPESANVQQKIWIPAPFEDTEMEFKVVTPPIEFCCKRVLQVPRYQSYFDGGTFELNCTNHNDLGFLDTQEKTADFRSSGLILPALELMRQSPQYVYTMECTAYLIEFLERHPEKREEMAAYMRQGRFAWGASYVEMLELSAGPEKLVRQFYFGRRWLKKTFPGVDTHLYFQTDPPSMSLQMPQILVKAGIKYCLLGRLPYGFYNWESPDGSTVFTYGYRYGNPRTLLDPKDHTGWLRYAADRESYYRAHQLPRSFIYDDTIDDLPPQPDFVPYVRNQNKSMEEFATLWNNHFAGEKSRQIDPPKMGFTTPEAFLDRFTTNPLDIPTLHGDWPLNWAYYDEPSHREALLDGRCAHNDLLSAERLYAGLGLSDGFTEYPALDFENAWRANTWPDHGWGGNHGTISDQVYADSYSKSKTLAAGLLSSLTPRLSTKLPAVTDGQRPIAVYNPLSWKRTDVVECSFTIPNQWSDWVLIDDKGNEVPCELLDKTEASDTIHIAFVAQDVPAVGYRCFFLKPSNKKSGGSSSLNNVDTIENSFFRALPVGTGKTFLSHANRFTDEVVGNWNVGAIVSLRSGLLAQCVTGADTANVGDVAGSERCNRVPGISPYAANKTHSMWLNKAAFALPAAYTYGTEQRDDYSGPASRNVDFNVFKNFPLFESTQLQFRAEAFNLFNTTNYGNPGATLSAASFGTITTAASGREVQVALKLMF